MEVVSLLAGEPFSDHPECASPVLGVFLRSWNDSLDDDERQDLLQYAPRLVNSRGSDEIEEKRAWMAADWLVRVYTPAWLRLAGLKEYAEALTQVGPLDSEIPAEVQDLLNAAWDAAWDVARDAARASVRGTAGNAAQVAARRVADAAAVPAHYAAWLSASAAHINGTDLEPTVKLLQESAHELVDRMLAVTEN